ncbi:uncharacterized protein HHUB_3507 [Halobacterium hubeiense]|uniref:Uncharacterized protein n=1 Tax=Halobacterium hubeiense TaxID=1407499 RepID=A0A0U5H7C5_9EURY|nr:uncharacterized protein HHUB_3507 [Halobacterium hubeiense]
MFESNDSDQEPSVVQHRKNDGCPVCRALIRTVERRGPGDVVVQTCGHEVGDTLARNFPRTEVDA